MHNNLDSEIMQLKADLMDSKNPPKKYNSSFSGTGNSKISSIVQKELTKKINSKAGKLFEENIRKSLEINLKWEEGKIKRSFFYREISFQNKKKIYIICPNVTKTLPTQEGKFIFKFNKDNKSCEIFKKNNGQKVTTIEEQNDVKEIQLNDKNLCVGAPQEFEIDGLYKGNLFDLSLMENEIDIIYKNIKNENAFDYIAIEIKLNYNKIDELIEQIKKKKKILENIFGKHKKNILYIGFVAYSDFHNFKEISLNFNCLILLLKESGILFGRNATEYIDWKTVSEIKKLKEDIDSKYDEMTKKIDEMAKKMMKWPKKMMKWPTNSKN